MTPLVHEDEGFAVHAEVMPLVDLERDSGDVALTLDVSGQDGVVVHREDGCPLVGLVGEDGRLDAIVAGVVVDSVAVGAVEGGGSTGDQDEKSSHFGSSLGKARRPGYFS